MKRILQSVVWSCAAAVLPVFASAAAMTMNSAAPPASVQGQEGDNIATPEVGLIVPVSELNLSRIGGGSQSPGDPGLTVGARYLRQTSERLSLGAQIVHANLGDRDFVTPELAGTIGGSLLTVEGLARYWLTSPRTLNPYVIGGVGFNNFNAHVRETFAPADVLLDGSSVGLALSAGGGVEGRFGKEKNVVAGAELGWMLATIDSGKFGSSALNAMGLGGRVGYKF